MRRRALLVSGATVGLTLLAGCGDTQLSATDTPADGQEPTPTETTTETDESGSETTSEAASGPENPTETTDSNPSDDPGPSYGTLFAFADSYAFEGEFSDPESGATGRITARYHGSDFYQRIEQGSMSDSVELYGIDDDKYMVLNGETCFRNPGSAMQPDTSVDGDAEEYGDAPDPEMNPSGTTRIDGERVYIFEMSTEDSAGPLTLYVSVSTGYLRRVETDTIQLDYHSWGEVGPITPPDMDCQALSD